LLALFRSVRVQLRRPGLPLAFGIALFPALLSLISILVFDRSSLHFPSALDLGPGWRSRFDTPLEFLELIAVMFNPIFLAGTIWALVSAWKNMADRPLLKFFLLMSAPLLISVALPMLPLQTRINCFAAAVIPLCSIMVVFWRHRFTPGTRLPYTVFALALMFGALGVGLLHESGLAKVLTGSRLPAEYDPLQRVRGWTAMGKAVSRERTKLESEGKPVFVIGDNDGTTSLLSFYMAEARTNAAGSPIVYNPGSRQPAHAEARTGQNAIYVQDSMRPETAPPDIAKRFASMTNASAFLIHHRGRPIRFMRYFICRDLQP